jgi:LacI family transcriptional regulator
MQPRGESSPATIYDVAARAGVSIATVSRVVNGHDSIRQDTRGRVLQAIRELGFVPNNAARGLSSGSKRIIGLVFARVPSEDDLLQLEEETLLFTDSVIRGAELAAQRNGYSLLLHGTGRAKAASAIAALTSSTDGLILADQVLAERRVAPIARRFPIVLLAGSGHSRTAATVRVDNRLGMGMIAEHLVVAHGMRRLAFLAGSSGSPDSDARGEAFRQTAEALGATVEPGEWWPGDWSSAGAAETVQRRLSSGRPLPDAIACASDSTAIGVQHALSAEGIQVPTDVAVTGFDDIPLARHLTPGLTTVNQPIQRLGMVAVEALLARVSGAACARDIVLPTQLVVRASCGCAPGALDGVARWRSDDAVLVREPS